MGVKSSTPLASTDSVSPSGFMANRSTEMFAQLTPMVSCERIHIEAPPQAAQPTARLSAPPTVRRCVEDELVTQALKSPFGANAYPSHGIL